MLTQFYGSACLVEGYPDDPVVGGVRHVEEALLGVEGQVVLVEGGAHVEPHQLTAPPNPVKHPAQGVAIPNY